MCPWAGYLTAPNLNLLTSETGILIFIAGLMKIKEGSTWYMETIILLCLHESPEARRAAAAAKLLQSCPTLCDPIDGSPPGPPSLGCSRVRCCDYGYTTCKLRSRTLNTGLLALQPVLNTHCLPNAFHQLCAERK